MSRTPIVHHKTGGLLAEETRALVNCVNCGGVMGGASRWASRGRNPTLHGVCGYRRAGEVRLGRMFVFKTGDLTTPRYIVSSPTKNYRREMSHMTRSNPACDP